MAFAEKVPSPKGDYWRGRFQAPDGRYISVRDEQGRVIRYPGQRAAKKAAEKNEADAREGTWRDPSAGTKTFAAWAAEWYAELDLAESTMANLKRHLENHLLGTFGTMALRDITPAAIGKWEREELKAGYAKSSIRTWRGTLHTVLEDAVGEHIGSNPSARKRGRGKRSGRLAGSRGPEKVITSPSGVLLIAERMAILSGRDDEFVMTATAFWGALRLGELAGLEKSYVRARSLRVEWQLQEVEGRLLRAMPKDGSYGDPLLPPFLRGLLAAHMSRARPEPCPCHGQPYVFRGMGAPRGRAGNMTLRELAAAAGTSQTVVATVLGGKGRVGAETRARVEKAIAAAGFDAASSPAGRAWHWRRSSLEAVFAAAASGRMPPKAPLPERPVLLAGDWPGTRVRGRNPEARAEWCWLPVADGLTPHGLRHSCRTWLEEQRIPEVLAEAHLRHQIPGISGVYRHITEAMRGELSAAMTEAWNGALDERRALSPRSPVAVLDGLLLERAESQRPRLVGPVFPRDSPGTPEAVLPFRGRTASDQRRGDWI